MSSLTKKYGAVQDNVLKLLWNPEAPVLSSRESTKIAEWKKWRIAAMVCAICLGISATPVVAQPVDRKIEFEISFLSSNYNAIKLPSLQNITAGALLDANTYSPIDTLSDCVDDDTWNGRYERSDASYAMSFINKQRSGSIQAEGTIAGFEGEGTVNFTLKEEFSEDETSRFALEADSFNLSRRRLPDLIKDDKWCRIFQHALLNNYLYS